MSDRSLTYALIIAGLALLMGWSLLAFVIVPPFVESAYRGESLPFLNAIIEGRDVHSLESYLDRWSKFARIGVVLILGVTSMALLLTRRGVQRRLDRLHGEPDLDRAARIALRSTGRAQRRLANLWIAIAVGGSLVCIVRAKESWPLSHYDMYAAVRTERDFVRFNLFGVVDDSTEVELDYRRHLPPFDVPRLHTGLRRLQLWHGEERARRALEAVALLYEQRRAEGRHEGPPIRGVRYYRLDWDVDPWARNRATPRERTLLAEVRIDD